MASQLGRKRPFDCETAIQKVARGYELTARLQSLLGPALESGAGRSEVAGVLVNEVLQALDEALSLLNSSKSAAESHVPMPPETGLISSSIHGGKVSGDSATGGRNPRDQGNRRNRHSRTAVTSAPLDDGHQWRKYGQKKIQNSRFPRCYYRCTYKDDQGCPATKQIQQRDQSDPPLFMVTYSSEHTCSTIPTTIPQLLEDSAPNEPFLLHFGTNVYGVKQKQPRLSPLTPMTQDSYTRGLSSSQDDTCSSLSQSMSSDLTSLGSMEMDDPLLLMSACDIDDIFMTAYPELSSHSSDVDYTMMDSIKIEYDDDMECLQGLI